MIKLRQQFENLLGLFYPKLCLACGKNLPPRDESICIHCLFNLSKTEFHLHKENRFTEHFWGRVKIENGAALYTFVKGGRAQRLIHNLKYKNKTEIGIKLGRNYGKDLKSAIGFSEVDLILPVPLHPRKQKLRGYNQSDMFAMGLSETMEVPWKKDILLRQVFTTTQTKKKRIERFENVHDAFFINKPEALRGKHVLIVDDVMTTGATLEACASKVLEISNTKVSLATIGFGKRI